ncbi:MAG: flagellar biosynthesis anti-sigma factor FlgM [Planctomycetota bacterium]
MQINPHVGDVDPGGRRRQTEQMRGNRVERLAQDQSADGAAPARASIGLQAADIARYVDMLKRMDPVDLHRVDEIRQRIADGSYDSGLDDLIDPLLDFISDDPA